VDLFRWFGMHFDGKISLAIANTLMLNSILFMGEIAQYFSEMQWSSVDEISLFNFKNIFLVPIFEELIFRVCLINIFIEANILSINKCVLILPLFFAVAHLHNLYRQRHLPAD